MSLNEISYAIRGAAFDVYNELGPGLLESIYQKALVMELEARGHQVNPEKSVKVFYKGIDLNMGFRADLVVDNQVLIELKSIDSILPVHKKQLLTYLRVTGLSLGLLINFNESPINIIRLVNGYQSPSVSIANHQ